MKNKKARINSTNAGENYTQCPNQSVPYLIGDSDEKQKRTIVKARCKQWDCPYCAEINRTIHYNRVVSGLMALSKRGYQFTFTTITCHEKWRGQEDSIRNWRTNKDKLLARYRRYIKKDCAYKPEYVYIPEIHADGTIHIHGLFTGTIQTRWWKDNARACGLGYMAQSEGITSILQAVNYCTKYITKQMGVASVSKNFRRINYSRGFPAKSKPESHLEWRILKKTESIQDAIIEGLLHKNYEVDFDGKKWSTDDFL